MATLDDIAKELGVVEADVCDACLFAGFYGFDCLFGIVSPSDEVQYLVVECLCTYADAVDGCLADVFQPVVVYVVGVCFDGYFCVGCEGEVAMYGLEDCVE